MSRLILQSKTNDRETLEQQQQRPVKFNKVRLGFFITFIIVLVFSVICVIIFSVNQSIHFIPGTVSTTAGELSYVFVIIFVLLTLLSAFYVYEYTTYIQRTHHIDRNTYEYNKVVREHQMGKITKSELQSRIKILKQEQKEIYRDTRGDVLLDSYTRLTNEQREEIPFDTFARV